MADLVVCLDTNVYVSAVAFGGKPLTILERALRRDFLLVIGPPILAEVRRTLVGKLGLQKRHVDAVLSDLLLIATSYVPQAVHPYTGYPPDDLVIAVALLGGADVLVTGDRAHLLPLGRVEGCAIEPPSRFLARFAGETE